jgi:hypothetical protein
VIVESEQPDDVLEILLFLSRFVGRREESIEIIDRLLSGNTGVIYKGRDLFADEFGYLHERGLNGVELYGSTLGGFFNSIGPGKLRAEMLKSAEGEIPLRLGDNEPFGVVNVGKAYELAKLREEHDELIVSEDNL